MRKQAIYWTQGALLFAVYFLTARFGLGIAPVSKFATLVWPPTGIALAALLVFGYRLWPFIFSAAVLVNFSLDAPFPVACGIGAGNTLEAVAGAWLLRRTGFHNSFDRLQDVLKFVVFAGLLSTLISSVFGVSILLAGQVISWPAAAYTWETWWVGDILGNLVVAPFLLTWSRREAALISMKQAVEGLGLVFSVVAVNHLVFGEAFFPELRSYPISYLVFLPLIWAALRFGQRGATAVSLLTAMMALRGTAQGLGPFAEETLGTSLLFLQSFMGIVVVTTLILAATVEERKLTKDALEKAYAQMEQKVHERTKELRQTLGDLQKTHENLMDTQIQLIQAVKMESVGRLAAGVAHEVKNPLAIITQGVEYLSQKMANGAEESAVVLDYTKEAIHRADRVIKGMLDFSRTQGLELKEEDLNRVIQQTLLLTKHELDKNHVTVAEQLDPSLPRLLLDATKIQQVFVNLIMNATQAMPEGGVLTLRTSRRPFKEKGGLHQAGERGKSRFWPGDSMVIAEVTDTGTGIPEEILNKIFDPFFTTKPTGQGTGLGLTVTKAILDLHEAAVDIANRPEGGIRVTLMFKGE